MLEPKVPVAAFAAEVPPRLAKTIYPEPFAWRVARREKRALGDLFGLRSFVVNLTRLAPASAAAQQDDALAALANAR